MKWFKLEKLCGSTGILKTEYQLVNMAVVAVVGRSGWRAGGNVLLVSSQLVMGKYFSYFIIVLL